MYVYTKKLLSVLLLSPIKNNFYLFINYDNNISIKVNSGCDERIYNNNNNDTNFDDLKDFDDFDDSLNKLHRIRTNFIKKNILNELTDDNTSIYKKMGLIDAFVRKNDVPLFNLTAGSLMDDFNFML